MTSASARAYSEKPPASMPVSSQVTGTPSGTRPSRRRARASPQLPRHLALAHRPHDDDARLAERFAVEGLRTVATQSAVARPRARRGDVHGTVP
jgi:hypothetical protein